MVKNLSREFATMTDEERRRFALERGGASGGAEGEAAADELELDDPRNPDHMGRQFASAKAETADPDARDGEAALLDDAEHERRVNEERQRRQGG
jgi:hypothetical protein